MKWIEWLALAAAPVVLFAWLVELGQIQQPWEPPTVLVDRRARHVTAPR